MSYSETVALVGKGVDACGVLVILLGILYATGFFLADFMRKTRAEVRPAYRRRIGAGILLALSSSSRATSSARSPWVPPSRTRWCSA
jgi:hypothetical protein